MKRLLFLIVTPILIASFTIFQTGAVAQAPAESAAGAADRHRAMLNTYCVGCHNTRAKTGGLALDRLDLQSAADDAQIWEKALRKLRGHLMPPPGSPQPPQKNVDSFVDWMENNLDSHAADADSKAPKAGYVPIQRLNRTEYVATVKALVGVDLNAKDILPQDIKVEGFDNVAAALSVSPSFFDQYLTAARHVAQLAIGNPSPRVSNVKYSIAANQNPDEPLPLGTRGGVKFKHNFPADGEYRINLVDLSVGLYTATMEHESTVVIMIDGRTVFRKPIGGPAEQALADRKGAAGRAEIMERFTKIPVQVEAGVRDVVVAFIDRSHVESGENIVDDFLSAGLGPRSGRMAHLVNGVEIVGPYNPKGVSPTPSRDLIFVCDPAATGEPACARKITESLARRAFRRPLSETEVSRLLRFYDAGREGGGSFDQGIEQVVAAVLATPEFLYRTIRGAPITPRDGATPGVSANGEVALTDLELASRLSFFVWNTGPDEELLTLAAAGRLNQPGAVEAQVGRMLADPKASSLVTSFAMKWLSLDDLDSVKPDLLLFPEYSDQLRHDFLNEAEAFLGSILLKDRSVVDLLTANYTFLNERLARHYGISGVLGNQFRRVTVAEKERAGLLGKGAILMRTSYADRTSPVLRGAWVLDKLLNTPPTPPPPNVATNLDQAAGEQPKTVRARLEFHRDKATCKQCHGVIDPMGLALENFDAIGQWRTIDHLAKAPIDASTVLPSGVPVSGAVELNAQLSAHPATFVRAFTEKLMTYALNRQLEYFDMPQVRAVVRGAAKNDYKFSSIVLGIVNTDAFRKQGRPASSKPDSKEDGAKSVASN
jgi:mono/diheme cytochrome c family protein